MEKNNEVTRPDRKLKLGIVGLGFVGKAVQTAFMTETVDQFIVDPKYYNHTLHDLTKFEPSITFVCLPTPSRADGSINYDLVDEAVRHIINNSESFIVIKSTITPDIVEKLTRLDSRIVYEPEFLTEANATMDFLYPPFKILGHIDTGAKSYLDTVYGIHSRCAGSKTIGMTPVQASFFKYAINNFLALKVIYFNQLKSVAKKFNVDYNQLYKILPVDRRVGHSHLMQPGPDGKEGFGGSCFPKDLNAFIHFAKSIGEEPKLLEMVKSINDDLRSQYELSEREIEQNVNYGQTKKELKDKDNGSTSEV
tara:strand:+ start:1575 stop:2498 length:924 start_codon:yes stop_codon:yes gene_type:complete